MINIFLIGFSNYYKNNLFFTEKTNLINNIDDADIIITSGIINKNTYDLLIEKKNLKKIIIFHLNDSLQKSSDLALKLYNMDFFDYVFGNINNEKYKYPNYIIPVNYSNLKEKNDYTKSMTLNKLLEKNKLGCYFDADKNNVINLIYNKLIINNKINKINKNDYTVNINKDYIFSICSENCFSSISGYITENVAKASLGCAIPILCGSFDNIDEQVFNKNRILFYDSNNEETLNNCVNKINELLNDNDKLLAFYKQEIFINTAKNTINTMISNIKNIFISEEEKIINKKELPPVHEPVVESVGEAVVELVPEPEPEPEAVPEPVVEKKVIKKQPTYSKKTLLKLRH